jgi:hypothetical protein
MLAALALWVCSGPIALPQAGGGAATQTFLFDADALAFRLGNIRAGDVPKLGAPFGPPEDATYVSVVSADAPFYAVSGFRWTTVMSRTGWSSTSIIRLPTPSRRSAARWRRRNRGSGLAPSPF